MRQYLDVPPICQYPSSIYNLLHEINKDRAKNIPQRNKVKYFLEIFNETFHTQPKHTTTVTFESLITKFTTYNKTTNQQINQQPNNYSNMKYTAVLASTTALLLNNALAMPAAATTNNPAIISMPEALEAINQVSPPTGVSFTGAAEAIKEPDMKHLTANNNEIAATDDKQHESWFGHGRRHGFGHRWWGSGAFGAWGGWGGYGPYRFGFNCGGIPGWAYPLSFWNAYGADIYGGSCGLGFPYGGLYYC